MESRPSYFRVGTSETIVAGVSVTEGELHMQDGKSLEHVGVKPDRSVLPTPRDLAAGLGPRSCSSSRRIKCSAHSRTGRKALSDPVENSVIRRSASNRLLVFAVPASPGDV